MKRRFNGQPQDSMLVLAPNKRYANFASMVMFVFSTFDTGQPAFA
jgi:hypothetical protein